MSETPTIQNAVEGNSLLIPDLDRRDTHGNPTENLEDGQAVLYYEAEKLFYAENDGGEITRKVLNPDD